MDYEFNFGDFEALFGFLAGFLVLFLVLMVAFLIFYFIGMYKLYRKSGKNGWECFIPFYSTYVLTEIAGLNWWWFLIIDASALSALFIDSPATSLLSLVSTFGHIVSCYNMSKKYNKDTGWFILSIFFGGFTFPILGYSNKTVYYPNAVVSKNGFFKEENYSQNQQPNQPFNNYGQPMNNQPYNNYGQPMNNQPYNNYGQPMNNQPYNNYGQPMNNQPYNNYGQPMNNQPQNDFNANNNQQNINNDFNQNNTNQQ